MSLVHQDQRPRLAQSQRVGCCLIWLAFSGGDPSAKLSADAAISLQVRFLEYSIRSSLRLSNTLPSSGNFDMPNVIYSIKVCLKQITFIDWTSPCHHISRGLKHTCFTCRSFRKLRHDFAASVAIFIREYPLRSSIRLKQARLRVIPRLQPDKAAASFTDD